MVTWHILGRVATSVGSYVYNNLYERPIQVFKIKSKKVNYPLAHSDWLTLTCTETRWGWLPVKVYIVSLCVSLSAVISCVIGAAPSQERQSISQHQTQVAEARESVEGIRNKHWI